MDFHVGSWLVQPQLLTLVRGGRQRHLSPKAMDVLVYLARQPGEVVSKDRILQVVWADTFVTDDSLVRCISELRHAFEDDAREPAIIETIAKRGYRLVAPVARGAPGVSVAEEQSGPGTAWWKTRRTVMATGLVVLFAVLIALSAAFLQKTWRAARPGIESLAVLPLVDLSGDPKQEYFIDGMTEELITALAQLSKARVISRTSVMRYKGTARPLPEIARELGVNAVVEGTVLRSGNRVRITAQLIDAATDQHLWSGSFHREMDDVLALQDGIARAIAAEVDAHVNRARIPRPRGRTRKVVPEAYDAYLRGWYLFNRDQFVQARDEFEQATIKDPGFALAYALLAESEGMARFRLDEPPTARLMRAAERARDLDDTLAEVHTTTGDTKFFLEWDWQGGLAEYHRATVIDPGSVFAALHYALALQILRQWDAAIREAKRAVDLDPLSPRSIGQLLSLYVDTQHHDLALEQFHKIIDLEPNNLRAWSEVAWVYNALGRPLDAVGAWLRVDSLSGMSPDDLQALTAAAHTGGVRGYWTKRLELLETRAKHSRVPPLDFALAYAQVGRIDDAFSHVDRARQERSTQLPWLVPRLKWAPLRSDFRFAVLLRGMRFPE